MKVFKVYLLLMLFSMGSLFAQMVFTYNSKQSDKDKRQEYSAALLDLALKKTVDKYGSYKLQPAPKMNHLRLEATLQYGNLPNFFAEKTVSKERLENLGYVPFPLARGIVGYRVFFVSPDKKEALKKVKTLKELKQFSIGQGAGWLDSKILEKQGFKVFKVASYNGLFKMVAAGRFDLYARGANEIYDEYESFKDIKGIEVDDNVLLYYPLPRFFFTKKSNTEAIKRVNEGLKIAYQDGSFEKLWYKYFGKSIEFVDFSKRKIFTMENPFLEGIDESYNKYLFKPSNKESK